MLDKSKKTEETNSIEATLKKNLLNYSKMSKNTDYATDINGLDKMSFHDLEAKLEGQVVEQLKSEFPGIEKSKSFGLLVDAVVNNIKNKDLKISEKRSIE